MSKSDKPPRVFAFIDSQNLNVGTQKSGWKMDWRKFRKFLSDQYNVSKAYMFIGYIPEMEDLYEQMHQAGYSVVLKTTFDMTRPQPEMLEIMREEQGKKLSEIEENGQRPPIKGNIDAELVLWAMKELSNYEQAVIISGDGDFYCLVEYLEQKGRLKALLAPSRHYSSLYNRYEKYVVQLDQYRRQLAYHDRKKG